MPTPKGDPSKLTLTLLWIQGLYFLATATWPLIDIDSFEAVTGPKTDDWLVKTVAVIIVSVALPMLLSAWRRRCPTEIVLLAMGSATGLTVIDTVHVCLGVIPPIYLTDAVAEVVLIIAWTVALLRK